MTLLSNVYAQAHHVLTERLRPGTPEFAMLSYQPLMYWLVAGFYDVLDHLKLPLFQRYKIVRRDPGRGNMVTRYQVITRVLTQHLIQFALTLVLQILDPGFCTRCDNGEGFLQRAARFILGMFVMDTYQYWFHRSMHLSKFLYRHMHSVHHKLTAPYAYGAMYNTILEGVLLDTMGGVITHYVAGLDCWTATYLFIFANVKGVVDHCNYRGLPNPLHELFPSTAAFHDTHHDIRGIKMNFSQPFFTHWDWIMGTFLDPAGLHYSAEELKEPQKAKKHSVGAGKKQVQVAAESKARRRRISPVLQDDSLAVVG